MAVLQERFRVSERRACRAADQPRPTQRLGAPTRGMRSWRHARFCGSSPSPGRGLATRLRRRQGGRSTENGSTGSGGRRAAGALPKEEAALRGIGAPVAAMSPSRPNVVEALDFQFDQTSDGRTLKLLNVMDEYAREYLAIDVARSIDADDVVTCLDRIGDQSGAPGYVRFDHGPEFIAYAGAGWCRLNGTGTVFIDPGSPWQNASIESFNGRLRDEFLNRQLFASVLEAWRLDKWRQLGRR